MVKFVPVSADIWDIGASRHRISVVFRDMSERHTTARFRFDRRMRIIRADDLYNYGNDTCTNGGGVQP
jgi:hypothetical protein